MRFRDLIACATFVGAWCLGGPRQIGYHLRDLFRTESFRLEILRHEALLAATLQVAVSQKPI